MFDIFLLLVFLFGFGYAWGKTEGRALWLFPICFIFWPIILGFQVGAKHD